MAEGDPTQGYQLPMTPAEFFRAGIAAANAYTRKTFQKDFDRLTEEQQIQVLQGLEQSKIALDHVAAQEFFNLLLNAAMEGFFADPIYGGNKNKVAWKMLGFPGVSPSTPSTSRRIATRSTTSSRRASRTCPEDLMATKLTEVDVVIVGLGWTGGILAKELTAAGMKVVALERGGMRSTKPDFPCRSSATSCGCPAPRPDAEPRARHTTFRNRPSEPRCRCGASARFCPAKASAAPACTGTA